MGRESVYSRICRGASGHGAGTSRYTLPAQLLPLAIDWVTHMSLQHAIQTIQITSATDTADMARFCAVPDGTPLDPATLTATGADEHWLLVDAAGMVARCSLWWSATPAYQQHRVGLIGHYAAADTLAEALLRHACDRLRQAGCTIAIGPMDGNTYNRY